MQEFVTTLFNGLSLGSIILLTSLGLAITFGLMRVINMAHGEFVMIGAYMTYVTQEVFAAFLSGGLTIGGCTFSYNRLFILGLVLVCMAGVGALMYRTAFGRQVRAVMQNRPMAQCMGINSRRVDCLTFSLGSGLAGLAGCSIALLGSIDATVGQSYIVNSFMAVVLGGVGRLLGTVVGSTAIGASSIFAENYTSATIAKAIVLLLVIVFLQKRPQGLCTIRSRSLDD